MGSVSISVSPVPPKESAKKKRTNRLAKLKQCKLDTRREQWLSQVKAKEIKTESNKKGRSPPTVFGPTQQKEAMESKNRHISLNEVEDNPPSRHGRNLKYLSSCTNCDVLGYKHSISPSQLTSSSSGNSSSGGSFWSISSSEEDAEEDNDCLDDWEAFADALTAHDDKELGPADSPRAEVEARVTLTSQAAFKKCFVHTTTETKETKDKPLIKCRAWSANDALRPQSLPNLSKKIGISGDGELNISQGNITQACQNITSEPTSCPICCEDLDPTDSSFQPCICGFRLCLFCHKRILEADSRCPGCRKHYNC